MLNPLDIFTVSNVSTSKLTFLPLLIIYQKNVQQILVLFKEARYG